jgi:hypothetical protein
MATFVSTKQGMGIGPSSVEGVQQGDDEELGNDTNGTSHTDCTVVSNGGNGGPWLASNGQGKVCIFSPYYLCPSPADDGVTVQCSTDGGNTWANLVTLANPPVNSSAYPTGAVSPGGKIAVTWVNTVPPDGGTNDEVFIAFSDDGGQTFGAPVQYPTAQQLVLGGPSYPAVAWENDDVLWLGQSVLGSSVHAFVDKTCDQGMSWSGTVGLGAYGNSSLFKTSYGMAAGVFLTSSGAGLFDIPLYPSR